jgi:hypothetical protein
MEEKQLLTFLKQMENNIIKTMETKIETKLDNITNEIIPKMNKKLQNIENKSNNIYDEFVDLKAKQVTLEEDVETIKEDVTTINERMTKTDKINEINELRIKSIEKDLDDKHDKSSQDAKQIKSLEDRIEDLEKKVEQTSYAKVVQSIPVTKPVNNGNRVQDNDKAKENTNTVHDNVEVSNKINKLVSEAKCKIGLYPISTANVRHFSSRKSITDVSEFNETEHDEARKDAVNEFLYEELKFKDNDIDIKSAKLAPKEASKIMWIETSEKEVKEIYKRAASVQNKSVQLYTYIPAQLWDRKISLDINCKKAREQNVNLRTQIRLGTDDLELYTKYKGEPYWQKTPVLEFGDLSDMTVKQSAQYSPIQQRKEQHLKRKSPPSPSSPSSSPSSSTNNKKPNLNY